MMRLLADNFLHPETSLGSPGLDEVRWPKPVRAGDTITASLTVTSKRASAKKMRAARDLFVAQHPGIECDGELHGDAALQPEIRQAYLGDSTLSGSANLLVCPNVDAANILYNVLKTTASGGVTVGPVLTGVARPAYILTPAATVRRVLNMTALAAAASPRG